MPTNKDPRKKPHKVHPNTLAALARSRVPFKKNDPETGEKDERINRKGAPGTTSAMRAFIKAIGAELVQLSSETATGRKRTKIVSRITKKITDMFDSNNPADSIALLKAAYPGLLSEEEEGKKKPPSQVVFKIVYENKRTVPQEELPDEEFVDAEELPNGGGGDRGAPFVTGATQNGRWGSELLQPENKNQHTVDEEADTDE